MVPSTSSPLQCQKCQMTFSQKSSLTRHSKRCHAGMQSASRRKACEQCSSAKAKCDLDRPTCGRCATKGIECKFTTDNGRGSHGTKPLSPPKSISDSQQGAESGALSPASDREANGEYHSNGSHSANSSDSFYTARLHMANVSIRLLKSYARRIVKGHIAPFSHWSLNLRPLRFLKYSKVEEFNRLQRSEFSDMTKLSQSLCDEMRDVEELSDTCDSVDLLEAVQAYLIYAVTVLFAGPEASLPHSTEQKVVLGLHDMSVKLALSGIVLPAESSGQIPHWGDWIIMETKRRTIFACFMFNWAWSVKHYYPQFRCTEIHFMQTPAARCLWEAKTQDSWEQSYGSWLERWPNGAHTIEENMNITADIELPERTELWLEETDEFGAAMMALGNAIKKT